MTDANSDLQAFAASVQTTLAAVQRLEAALQTEQAALTGHDPQQLEQAVQGKTVVLQELEPLLAGRDAIQARLGAGPGPAGADQLLASAPPDATIRRQWEELKARAGSVERLNMQNGQLAMQGEKTARQAVSLLTGRTAQAETYGRQGRSQTGLGGLTLAKA